VKRSSIAHHVELGPKIAFFGLGGLQKSLAMTDCSADGWDEAKGGNKSDALWAGGSLICGMSNGQVKLPSGEELPARVVKRIGALGHHVALWAEAMETLRGRLEKDRLPEPWRTHVRAALPEKGAPWERLEVIVRLPESEATEWVVEAAAEGNVPALRAGARALLHLPMLRKSWAGWLRESVFEDLKLRLGRAWLVDPTPLPSHGALPGLGIARWRDFERLRGTGRAFRISDRRGEMTTVGGPSSTSDWEAAAKMLGDCALGEAIVEELSLRKGSFWRAVFEVSEGRWEMTELLAK
jgi:hypothetical protein